MVNRAALTVIPKQAYVDWANTVFKSEPQLDANDPHQEYTVYLINEVDDEAGITRAIRRHYPYIFEQELAAWCGDTRAWPQRRDYRAFKNWFDVKVSSVVLDLSKHHFEVEEYED
jgi:hypothetical protein